MKIINLKTSNFLGIKSQDFNFEQPITLIAGQNGVGKSSIHEAIRLVFGVDGAARIDQKKHWPAMIADGEKKGSIEITLDIDGEAIIESIALPGGKRRGTMNNASPFLPYVLDPPRFASLDASARRQLLFDLTGCGTTVADIASRLESRGCDRKKFERILPLLRSGFPAAHEEAKNQCTSVRGAWRGVTGETYGEKKAVHWRAEAPAVDDLETDDHRRALAKIDSDIADARERLGRMTQSATEFAALEWRLKEHREAAGQLDYLMDLVGKHEAELAEYRVQVERLREAAAGKAPPDKYYCPECRSPLMWANASLISWHHEGKLPDREAAAALPRYERGLVVLENTLANSRKRLDDAREAGAIIQELESQIQCMATHTDDEIAALREQIAEMVLVRDRALKSLQKTQADIAAAETAEHRTKSAAQYHAEALAWASIADALAPNGIPADIFGDAIGPVNARLGHTSEGLRWHTVSIDEDMQIRAGGRPYRLLSESERWRVDLIVAEMVSHLSGLRMICVDRMDVLDIPARSNFIRLARDLVAAGELEFCLATATLKQVPEVLPPTVQGIWIESEAPK